MLVAQRRLGAHEAGLDLAGRRAAVAVDCCCRRRRPRRRTMPSPQLETQAPLPVQLGSVWQSAEQPSKGTVLPSSQLSAPSIISSPHLVGVQALGLPLHLKPSSTLQVAEQPSPAVGVAVVAELGQHQHAVATARDAVTGLTGRTARIARLDRAAIRRSSRRPGWCCRRRRLRPGCGCRRHNCIGMFVGPAVGCATTVDPGPRRRAAAALVVARRRAGRRARKLRR